MIKFHIWVCIQNYEYRSDYNTILGVRKFIVILLLDIVLGLTSDLYYYIILSTVDTCLWMRKVNFTGRLIYFDYQQNDCKLDYQQSYQSNEKSISKSKHHISYYRSTLSFRTDQDPYKTSNSTQLILTNSSLVYNSLDS